MSTEERPAHSPRGASGAERWMNCSGSVALIKEFTRQLTELGIPLEGDDPDYRKEGTAAHEALADCMVSGQDGWEIVGQEHNSVKVDTEMADAIQVFIDNARPRLVARNAGEFEGHILVERPLSNPAIKDMYGTIDFGVVNLTEMIGSVDDFKYGIGIAVDVEWNPQIMYYAYLLLLQHPDLRRFDLTIVQPRAFHQDGPIRRWSIAADELAQWAEETLIPAMLRTELDDHLDAGPWCRFCPAKLVCPMLESLFKAAATFDPKAIPNLTDVTLGRSYQYTQAVKFYLKAMEEETFKRLNSGRLIAGTKLVMKKANRVFKAEAAGIFKEKYGEKAFTEPSLRSPAQMEELDAEAKKLVQEWAYTPQSGLTVALEADKRPGVKVETTQAIFGDAVAKMGESNETV